MTEKEKFAEYLETFVAELKDYVSTEDGQWTVKGFVDIFKNVYTISADTKIVSKILEISFVPQNFAFCPIHPLHSRACRTPKLLPGHIVRKSR